MYETFKLLGPPWMDQPVTSCLEEHQHEFYVS
jgi:hypothetical protein